MGEHENLPTVMACAFHLLPSCAVKSPVGVTGAWLRPRTRAAPNVRDRGRFGRIMFRLSSSEFDPEGDIRTRVPFMSPKQQTF
jgi:hypothetical protein